MKQNKQNQSKAPWEYPRRVLLMVIGTTPQVVTEAIYALAVQSETPFIPTEVHLITTKDGERDARLALLARQPDAEEDGWFHRLCKDYRLSGIEFDQDCIHMIRGPQGQALKDVRSDTDTRAAADLITHLVHDMTADPDCALHVCLTGGRKTMTYYLGSALTLFGRAQDRLSHVLVNAPYETHRQFFYPTPQSRRIYVEREKRYFDCKDAEVTLAELPLLRLRDRLPKELHALESGSLPLSEIVERTQRSLDATPEVSIDYPAQQIIFHDGTRIQVDPTDLAFYGWIMRRQQQQLPGPERPKRQQDWNGSRRVRYETYFQELQREFQACGVPNSTGRGLKNKHKEAKPALRQSFFDTHRFGFNRTLKTKAGDLASPYLIHSSKVSGYGNQLSPQRIHFIEE